MYKINKYPDGTSYVTIPQEWEETTQNITFRINNYEDIIHLVQLCDVLFYNKVKAQITIPCLLDAQADKRFGEFNSSGLAVLARVLEDYVDGCNISLSIFHPHNPLVVEALFTSVDIINNSEFIKKVLYNHIAPGPGFPDTDILKNLILMSADAGGYKPLMDLCDNINWTGATASCSKHRMHTGEKTVLTQRADREDYKGADILIVDDLSVYGGTFKGLSKMLKERNCGKLYLAVSHMTVQNLGKDPVTNYFDKVFTTNSKFEDYCYLNTHLDGVIPTTFPPENLEVIKMF